MQKNIYISPTTFLVKLYVNITAGSIQTKDGEDEYSHYKKIPQLLLIL